MITINDLSSVTKILCAIALVSCQIDLHPNYVKLDQIQMPISFTTFKRLVLSLLGKYTNNLGVEEIEADLR